VGVNFRRERLSFERLAASGREQIAIEGECALSGSMRDAVTVLSVQAQAHITQTQALGDRIGVKGRVCFQVLYTQGDLTRIRAIETTCDFTHELAAQGAAAGMRTEASVCVLETDGAAASGRMALRALIDLEAKAFDSAEQDVITGIDGAQDVCVRMQNVTSCAVCMLGEETAIVREEFHLADRLQIQNVLTATGEARITDITGGAGRVGVSGVVELRVLHQPQSAGEPLVETMHEIPFKTVINAQLAEEVQPFAAAEVLDVMADSVLADKQRTMRAEAEVRIRLLLCRSRSDELLDDLYSTSGPVLEPVSREIDVQTAHRCCDVRESVRIQATLPPDAPPVDTVLAAFALPVLTGIAPAGKRLSAEGIAGITLVYLPVDSDIPYAVRVREPFAMTFPAEAEAGAAAGIRAVECSIGPATSDRVELRCLMALQLSEHAAQKTRVVTDVGERPEEKREHGFVLVWPAPGETRWDTARRLRVPQENLRPAGTNALLAFRR